MRLFHLITAAAAAGGLCLLRSEYEKNHFVTEVFTVHSPKVRGEGKTFVFLTDLHNKEFDRENRRLISSVRAAKPDAVLIGGDMMISKGNSGGDTGAEVALKLIETIAKEFPVYYGNGNHETRMQIQASVYGDQYQKYMEELRRMGVVCLSDQSVRFGEDFVIAGFDVPFELYRPGYPKMKEGAVELAMGKAQEDRFTILLAHSPLYFKQYAAWGADLTLSGHFHGGTIRLPVLGGVMTPQYQFFCPWCAGEFEENGKKMIVGRGLGTHSVNIRFNDKPQVVVVKIER